jgi:hypothetical protein
MLRPYRFAGLQINCAVDVDAPPPARLLESELLITLRQAARGPRGMGWMHRVPKQHGFVVSQGIQKLVITLNERFLFIFVELARDDIRLVIFETQTMEKRDQSRAAFVDEAELLFDPGTDLVRRAGQRSDNPRFQIIFLLGGQIAGAPAHIEARQALDPALFEKFVPAAVGVVIQQQPIGDFPSAPPIVQKHRGVGPARYATDRRTVARQRDQLVAIFFAEEATLNHARNRIRPIRKHKKFLPDFQ